MSTSIVRVILPFLLALVALGPVAVANAEPDPPARVGRASLVEGDVAYLRDGEWAPLPRNWPITAGARLSTAPGARAEVRIGSTAVRMASTTELEFVQLDDDTIEIRLLQGTIDARVRSHEFAQSFSVETPEARTTLPGPGRYRFDAGVVRRADAEPDAFDEWALARDRREDASRSARYVSPEMTGYESLDDHGDWREVTEYGPVWVPRAVPAGWAPYRTGRWAWIAPWGWTWIDEAPWGFAPFHYGRWALIGGVWAWAPGRIVARPVFAPALVGWVGRPGWSVTVSVGAVPAVGWFPLAPREVFVPAYRHSPGYVRQVNVAHVTNVTQITNVTRVTNVNYAHRHLERAVTVVPAAAVTGGRPVGREHVHVRRADLVREASASNVPPAAAIAPVPRPQRDDDRRFEGREPDTRRDQSGRRNEQRRVDDRPSAPAVATAPIAPPTASAPTQSAPPAPAAPQQRVAPAPRAAERAIDRAPPRGPQPPITREAERAAVPVPTPPIQAAPASPRSNDGARAMTPDRPNPREDRQPRRNTESTIAPPPPRTIEQRAEPMRVPHTEQRREPQRIESPRVQRADPPRAIGPVAPTPASMQPQARPLPQPSPPAVVRAAPPAQQTPPTMARPAPPPPQPQPQAARPAQPPPPQQAQQQPQSRSRGDHDRGQAREQRRGEGRGPG